MKTVDKIFLISLLVIPLIAAIGIGLLLVRRTDVAPEDSSAATPTPTYEIEPINPSVSTEPTVTTRPTTTTTITTPTSSYDTAVTATPLTTTKPPTITPTPTNILSQLPDTQATITPTPTTTDQPEETTPSPTQPASSNTTDTGVANIFFTASFIAFVTGALILLGTLIRKNKV